MHHDQYVHVIASTLNSRATEFYSGKTPLASLSFTDFSGGGGGGGGGEGLVSYIGW